MAGAASLRLLVVASNHRSSLQRIAATPAEGLRGLAVKLGLHEFLSDHGDAASLQCDSAYSDLVRLTGTDPMKNIALQEVLRGTAGDLPLFVMAPPNASRSGRR